MSEPQVIVPLSLVESILEQIDFWRDSVDDEEDKEYLFHLMGDMEAAKSQKTYKAVRREDLGILHELCCNKEVYDTETEEQDAALVRVFI
jgi:hypothetical protein